jgi:predicted HicB family RNase H-like nuclease
MSRPATEAAQYEKFTTRLPADVAEALRDRAARSKASFNTELIGALRRALRLPAPMKRARHPALADDAM